MQSQQLGSTFVTLSGPAFAATRKLTGKEGDQWVC
jgi:hypothetical protein